MRARRGNALETLFERKRRGYDCEAVNVHVQQLEASYADVRREREDLSARVTGLERQLERYRELEQRDVGRGGGGP